MSKHDQLSKNGFNVDPELLAHDLAMLMLSEQENIQELCKKQKTASLYSLYTELLHEAEIEIAERTKYDDLRHAKAKDPTASPDDN